MHCNALRVVPPLLKTAVRHVNRDFQRFFIIHVRQKCATTYGELSHRFVNYLKQIG